MTSHVVSGALLKHWRTYLHQQRHHLRPQDASKAEPTLRPHAQMHAYRGCRQDFQAWLQARQCLRLDG